METFVVRVWLPADPPSDQEIDVEGLRGVVQRIGSPVTTTFVGGDQLVGLIQASIDELRALPSRAPLDSID